MRIAFRRFLVLAAVLLADRARATSPIPLPSQRQTLSLDGAWTMSFNGVQQNVVVPGNIPFTFGESVWRRTFSLNLEKPPAVALLEFDGIVNQGRASLNGSDLGPLYAFTATRFDVASLLRLNGENELLVTLDDRLTESSVPGGLTSLFLPTYGSYAYTFPVAWANRPGIIRSVRLTYAPAAVVTDFRVNQSFAPALEYVDLRIQGSSAGRVPGEAHVDVEVRQASAIVGRCYAFVSSSGEFQCQFRVDQPRLWSPDSPTLYEVRFELAGPSGAVFDAGYDRIGLRKFEARGARFYLNNAPIFLRGIARHDIYGERGFVADEQTIRSDLNLIKALGVNFVRCIHYPHNEAVLRAADEIGLLLSEELPAWALYSRAPVIQAASSMLASLLLRDFNRPSVVLYLVASVNQDRGEPYLRTLLPLARSIDPSRPASFIFDDAAYTSGLVAANAAYAGSVGGGFYAQNTYWHSSIFDAVVPGLPASMPFLSTEWTGAEGSDRGPLGNGPTESFPSQRDEGSGFPEVVQAQKMAEAFGGFFPYVCTDSRPEKCLAGVVFFNFQDVEWPGMPVFYKNHLPFLRNGLVYEDRVLKAWPVAMFRYLMWWLPQ